jgi:tetratricopeptide (TPR) repeat protein
VVASPNNVAVIGEAAITNLLAGSLDAALVLSRRAIELSPGDPRQAVPLGALAHTLIVLGRYEEALEPAARAVAFHARFHFAYWMLIAANAHLGRMEAAKSWLAEYLKLHPAATIESIAAGQNPRWPERIEPILNGLRLAGLAEQ